MTKKITTRTTYGNFTANHKKQIAYNTPKPKQEWVQLELDLADTIKTNSRTI